MDDKQSFLDALMRQATTYIPQTSYMKFSPSANCNVNDVELQDCLTASAMCATTTLKGISEELQAPNLRIDELSTIRKLLEQCTIDATKREVLHVLEAACSHPEECVDCPYKSSLGECNRNERIADILLNRFGRVK